MNCILVGSAKLHYPVRVVDSTTSGVLHSGQWVVHCISVGSGVVQSSAPPCAVGSTCTMHGTVGRGRLRIAQTWTQSSSRPFNTHRTPTDTPVHHSAFKLNVKLKHHLLTDTPVHKSAFKLNVK